MNLFTLIPNGVDPGNSTCYKPSYQDRHCLQKHFGVQGWQVSAD